MVSVKLLRRAGGALSVTILGGLLLSSVAQATTKTFTFTGAEQTFVVPTGISKLHVDAVGAPGGHGGIGARAPGGSVGSAQGPLRTCQCHQGKSCSSLSAGPVARASREWLRAVLAASTAVVPGWDR